MNSEIKQWLEGYMAAMGGREPTPEDFYALANKIKGLGPSPSSVVTRSPLPYTGPAAPYGPAATWAGGHLK